MTRSATHGRASDHAAANAAAPISAATMMCGRYTSRHQRCSMDRPRYIASHGERRRSAMAMSAGCTRAPGEGEVEEEEGPAGNADRYFRHERYFGERRPERFHERGGAEHERGAVHHAHRGLRRR